MVWKKAVMMVALMDYKLAELLAVLMDRMSARMMVVGKAEN